VKAVSLDVGWTIAYSRRSIWQILAHIARERGSALSAEEAEGLVYGAMQARRSEAIEAARLAAHTDSDEEFARQFDDLCRFVFAAGGVCGDGYELAKRFLERFWSPSNWALFPDVLPALRRARAAGIRIGLVSNAGSGLLGFVEAMGLRDLVDFVLVSAVEGVKKPDVRIFEKALRLAGVEREELVHVGDMIVEDVLGAQHAGIRALLMDRGDRGLFPHHSEGIWAAEVGVEVVRSMEEVLLQVVPGVAREVQ